MKIKWDIIPCAIGWQVEATVGDFTIYGPPKATVEKAEAGAKSFCEKINCECVFVQPSVKGSASTGR